MILIDAKISSPSKKEGLYDVSEGKNLNQQDRDAQQKEINDHINEIFGKKEKITYNDYVSIIKEISSDIFLSLMVVLHEKLPCSQNIFRLKKMYRLKS